MILYLIVINKKLIIIHLLLQFLKKLNFAANSIKDSFVKKYVLEFYLEKISKTPNLKNKKII